MYLKVINQNRNVLLYLLGAGISSLGNVISGLAFLFLAYQMTESSIHTTGVAISQVVPYLLFGLIGGVIADWVDKKRLLVIIDLIRVPLILSLVLFHQLEMLSYWHLIVVSFLIQCLGCFYNPAHRAILPVITTEEERSSVNSLFDTVTRGITVLGPIVSIGFINSIDIIHFFTFDALTYFVSALIICKIQFTDNKVKSENTNQRRLRDIFYSIKEFSIWVKRQTTIRTLFIVTVIVVFFNTWVWQVGLLLQLIETSKHGEELYSLLLGWYGVAVIAVNLLIPIVWKKLNMRIYLFGSLIWGIGIFLLGFAYNVPMYFFGVFIAAIGLPISGLARVYLLQKYLPLEKLGRGFSFNAVLLYLSNAISLSVFGFISTFVSTRILFIVCGTMMVICSLIYLLTISRKVPGVIPYNRLNN